MIYWILTTPRSGSNYIAADLWRRLGGTPRLMEYFNPEAIAEETDFLPRASDPVTSYLEHLGRRHSHDGVLCVKMLWIQVDACLRYGDFLPALSSGHVIHLRRRDVVSQGISRYIATRTGRWASGSVPAGAADDEVGYDFEEISRNVARMELHDALLRRFLLVHEIAHLRLCYEDYVDSPDGEARRVLAHLGLAERSVPVVGQEAFARQATGRNEEFHRRYLHDERVRYREGGPKGLWSECGDGTYRGPPPLGVPGDTPGRAG